MLQRVKSSEEIWAAQESTVRMRKIQTEILDNGPEISCSVTAQPHSQLCLFNAYLTIHACGSDYYFAYLFYWNAIQLLYCCMGVQHSLLFVTFLHLGVSMVYW